MSNKDIEKLLSAGIPNAQQEYSWLKDYAANTTQLSEWVKERANGKPLAYILGHTDFFGLNLIVSKNVLIPRHETEELIELVIDNTPKNKCLNLLDLGCGSGAIALTLKKHLPLCNVFALDLSMKALSIALKNQAQYPEISVQWIQGSWLKAINLNNIDIIVSNPPYVECNWQDNSITHEPNIALYSGDDGLDDIKIIMQQSCQHKHLDIWFEHGHQHDLSKFSCSSWNIKKFYDHSGSQRFTHLSCDRKHV